MIDSEVSVADREALLDALPCGDEWGEFRLNVATGSVSVMSDPASWVAACALKALAKQRRLHVEATAAHIAQDGYWRIKFEEECG